MKLEIFNTDIEKQKEKDYSGFYSRVELYAQ